MSKMKIISIFIISMFYNLLVGQDDSTATKINASTTGQNTSNNAVTAPAANGVNQTPGKSKIAGGKTKLDTKQPIYVLGNITPNNISGANISNDSIYLLDFFLKIENKSLKKDSILIVNGDTLLRGEFKEIVEYVDSVNINGKSYYLKNKEVISSNDNEVDDIQNESEVAQKDKPYTNLIYILFGLLPIAGFLYWKMRQKKNANRVQEINKINSDEKYRIEKLLLDNLVAGKILSEHEGDIGKLKEKFSNQFGIKTPIENPTELNEIRSQLNKKSNELLDLKNDLIWAKSNSENLDIELKKIQIELQEKKQQVDGFKQEKDHLRQLLNNSSPYPDYMEEFFNTWEQTYNGILKIEKNANKNSEFYKLISYLIHHENVKYAANPAFEIVRYKPNLISILNIDNIDSLKSVPKEVFFKYYINQYLERTLSQIAQLNAYASSSSSMGISSKLHNDGLSAINEIYDNLNFGLSRLGYSLYIPILGADTFDDGKYQKSNTSTLVHIARESVDRVYSGIIYDLVRVGFQNKDGVIIQKAQVVVKI